MRDRLASIQPAVPLLQRLAVDPALPSDEKKGLVALVDWLSSLGAASQGSRPTTAEKRPDGAAGRPTDDESDLIFLDLLRTYSLPLRAATIQGQPQGSWNGAFLAMRVLSSARTWRENASASVRRREKTALLADLETRVKEWNFDVFKVSELSGGRPLATVTEACFCCLGLDKLLGHRNTELQAYLAAVEGMYHARAYHNATHAADVVQAVASLLANEEFTAKLTDLEVLALLIAAAVHDVGHPGVTNGFLVLTRSPDAVTYNDQSVNENMHLAIAFRQLGTEGQNFLADLPEQDYRFVRRLVIELVLATDMINHTSLLKEFSAAVALLGTDIGKWESEARALLLKFLLHACDISNPSRPWPMCREWAERITMEMFEQGDQERSKGLPVSALNDRDKAHPIKSQIIFADMFVVPTWEALAPIAPTHTKAALRHCQENAKHWADLCAQGITQVPRGQ